MTASVYDQELLQVEPTTNTTPEIPRDTMLFKTRDSIIDAGMGRLRDVVKRYGICSAQTLSTINSYGRMIGDWDREHA